METPKTELFLSRDYGYTELRSAHRRGELVRVRPGAYIRADSSEKPWQFALRRAHARAIAVAAQSRTEVVFSHETAAMLHGCSVWRMGLTHVIQSGHPNGSPTRDVVRHTGEVADEDVVVINGLHVTSLARTVLDCARRMHPRDALVIADSAARLVAPPTRERRSVPAEAVWRAELLERLAALARAPGVARARAVVEAATALAEFPPETALRWIALSRGLPMLLVQMAVRTRVGTYYTDLGLRGEG